VGCAEHDDVIEKFAGLIRSSGQRDRSATASAPRGITRSYVERLARLTFVARHRQCDLPAEQPPELSAETLLKRIKMPLGWPEQWHALGIR
jgi:hypothetical protein